MTSSRTSRESEPQQVRDARAMLDEQLAELDAVNERRSREQEVGDLRAYGDEMQSALSRLAEYVLGSCKDVPYETRMAALEGRSAVGRWTETRRRSR